MLKDFAWTAFEFTGNIDSYIFYREIEERSKVKEQRRMAEDEAALSGSRS